MSIDELLERVRTAKEGSAEIDALLAVTIDNFKLRVGDGRWAVFSPDKVFMCGSGSQDLTQTTDELRARAINCLQGLLGVPLYTSSIDAALALVERFLPGTIWAVGNMEAGPFCRLVVPNKDGSYVGGYYTGEAHTPALAILAALLSAPSRGLRLRKSGMAAPAKGGE